jgi:drebrin-like protein
LNNVDGGLQEIYDEFEGSKIQYGFCRVLEPTSQLPKFVLICWCGDGTPVGKKGLFNTHVSDAASYFKGFHVQINARCEEDVDPNLILQKVKDSSGAKYSIQSAGNPSMSKPSVLPPKSKFVPPKPAYVPPKHDNVPSKAGNNGTAPSLATRPTFQHDTQIVTPQPVQVPQEEAKPLYSSTNSSYQPVKTNPKPLNNPFAKMESNVPEIQSKPVAGKVSQLASAFSQAPQPVKSSYEPIKMAPKPLYENGVATMSYPLVDAPRKSSVTEPSRASEVQRRQEQKLREQREREELEREEARMTKLRLEESQNNSVIKAREEARQRDEHQRQELLIQEQQRIEMQRKEQQREEEEYQRIEQQRQAQQRIETERIEKQRQEQQQRIETEQIAQQRQAQQRIEAERQAQQQQQESHRLERERIEERHQEPYSANLPAQNSTNLNAVALYDYVPGFVIFT